MKIYGGFASPYVARTVMAARAKGIDLPVVMPDGGIKSPDFLRLNPMGKMPTLEDNGIGIPESCVIMEYLEDSALGTPLLPKDPKERANARLIARITDLYLGANLGGLFRNMNPAKRNQAEAETSLTGIQNALGYLEHYTDANGPYLRGAQLTMADCTLLPTLLMSTKFILPPFGLTDPLAATPKLARWYAAMQSSKDWSAFCTDYCDSFQKFLASLR